MATVAQTNVVPINSSGSILKPWSSAAANLSANAVASHFLDFYNMGSAIHSDRIALFVRHRPAVAANSASAQVQVEVYPSYGVQKPAQDEDLAGAWTSWFDRRTYTWDFNDGYETSVTSSSAVSPDVPVSNASGFSAGDFVELVNSANGETRFFVIASISANTVTLDRPAGSDGYNGGSMRKIYSAGPLMLPLPANAARILVRNLVGSAIHYGLEAVAVKGQTTGGV